MLRDIAPPNPKIAGEGKVWGDTQELSVGTFFFENPDSLPTYT